VRKALTSAWRSLRYFIEIKVKWQIRKEGILTREKENEEPTMLLKIPRSHYAPTAEARNFLIAPVLSAVITKAGR
jgi:hypothetical protein